MVTLSMDKIRFGGFEREFKKRQPKGDIPTPQQLGGCASFKSKKVTPVKILHYLKGMKYPVDKDTILGFAEKNHAPSEIIRILKELPESEYDDARYIMRDYGKIVAPKLTEVI